MNQSISTSAQPDEASVLQISGTYRKIKCLGRGGFGEVWSAMAPGGVEIALKILLQPVDHEMAKREIKALEVVKQLHHPYLLQTHSFWTVEKKLIIAMELAEGSLRDRLAECQREGKPGIPKDELVGYMRESAEALDYLHSINVLHRDVKPENILRLQGHAKLADFGLARHQQAWSEQISSAGTLLYMAPEVLQGRASEHMDQYSLAATYVELRLGRRLYSSSNMIQLIMEHVEREPDLSGLPEQEQKALRRALAKDAEKRYPSCRAFVKDLAPQDSSTSIAALVEAPQKSRPWRLIAPFGAGMGVALLLLSVLAYRYLTAHPPEGPEPEPFRLSLPAASPVLKAGSSAPLALGIERRNFDEDIRLTFEAPPHVRIDDTLAKPGQDQVEVSARAGRFAATGEAIVRVGATAGHFHHEALLALRIEPPDSAPGYAESYRVVRGEEPRQLNERRTFYGRITLLLEDGTAIPFVLVAGSSPEGSRPFYIMEDKVSNGLFRCFISVNSSFARDPHWRRGGRISYTQRSPGGRSEVVEMDLGAPENFPVFRCSAEEAGRFAEWLGGMLPSDHEWDAAAGRGVEKLAGPFRGDPRKLIPWIRQRGRWWPQPGFAPLIAPFPQLDWPAQVPLIAVNRAMEGPLPIGSAMVDVSPNGCRDMSGNGYEWTRKVFLEDLSKRSVPLKDPQADDAVILRGQGYAQSRPLLFADLASEDSNYYLPRYQDREEYVRKAAQTSFRIVLEPEL
jgi:serine/threonine protein kinase/formylglycine-generating enzyme required for sulfatase activity